MSAGSKPPRSNNESATRTAIWVSSVASPGSQPPPPPISDGDASPGGYFAEIAPAAPNSNGAPNASPTAAPTTAPTARAIRSGPDTRLTPAPHVTRAS